MFQRTVSFWRRLIGTVPVLTDPAKGSQERRQSVRYQINQRVAYRAAAVQASNPSRSAQIARCVGGRHQPGDRREYRPVICLACSCRDCGGKADLSAGLRGSCRQAAGKPLVRSAAPSPAAILSGTRRVWAAGAKQPRRGRSAPAGHATPSLSRRVINSWRGREDSWAARVTNLSTAGVGLSVKPAN